MTNELYHHGVLGMHWGERRFQRENGTLTEKGKKRFEKVSSSERKKARETAAATRVLKTSIKKNYKKANAFDKAGEKNISKAESLAKKGEETGHFNKTKIKKLEYKALKNMNKYASLVNDNAVLEKKLKDINEGTLKAGRDFITQKDYDIYPFIAPTPFGLMGASYVRTRTKIIDRPKEA